MTRWHILASDAVNGQALYDDLIADGFCDVAVYARDWSGERGAAETSTVGDTPILASPSVGRMASAVLGASDPDPAMTRYEKDVEAGETLLIVDFPPERLERIRGILQRHPMARSPEAAAP